MLRHDRHRTRATRVVATIAVSLTIALLLPSCGSVTNGDERSTGGIGEQDLIIVLDSTTTDDQMTDYYVSTLGIPRGQGFDLPSGVAGALTDYATRMVAVNLAADISDQERDELLQRIANSDVYVDVYENVTWEEAARRAGRE